MALDDLQHRLKARAGSLTKTEARTAKFVARNRADVAFMPAARLAETIGVSESSILRFSRALGYENFLALQAEIQEEIRQRLKDAAPTRLGRAVASERDDWAYFEAAIAVDVENLEASRSRNDAATVTRFVDELKGARTVFVAGFRGASAVARLLSYTLNFVLDDVRGLMDAGDVVPDRLLAAREGDVLIACAFARHAAMTLRAVDVARRRGCRVLGLTDDPLSPLALAADASLVVSMRSEAFIQSYTAAFAVVHGLLAALGARLGPRAMARLGALEEELKASHVFVREAGIDGEGPP